MRRLLRWLVGLRNHRLRGCVRLDVASWNQSDGASQVNFHPAVSEISQDNHYVIGVQVNILVSTGEGDALSFKGEQCNDCLASEASRWLSRRLLGRGCVLGRRRCLLGRRGCLLDRRRCVLNNVDLRLRLH